MIERLKKWNSRQWVAAICGAVIILRAVFPGLRIDDTSLWLFVIAVVVVLIPDIGDLISRLKKVKKGDFELEFEGRLENLKRLTEETESEIDSEQIDFGQIPEEVQTRISSSLVEPRAALIALAVEIESRLRELAELYSIPKKGRFFSPRRAVDALVEGDIVDPHMRSLFADFWAIRNSVVHGHDFPVEREQLYSLVDLGMRILRVLYAYPSYERQNDSEGET